MKINYSKIGLTLNLIGVALFIINALDVYLGHGWTHGKGFQILGLGLRL
ncbi:hypothetical protein HG719_07755 [Methanobacterium subterraneum]|jgi:hypothetical protein|uniref:Uncharacterized protein n=1 Tax=Methanobacterium subterraneum TaxID=59277 RepID=A0A7K4DPC0_9EURY|nr:hypothetical protein [Methanobacterium subterraneum]NMO09724.1 hypothetical protein [Methanobacterium subterraneum]